MKKLSPADYRSMPWKNGAGTTIEIAVFPEHAKLEDFIWRVSRAQVVSDGGFSHFAGIDRSLALLQGSGMRLSVNEFSLKVDAENNIAIFAGDAATHAELINGAISDFNLMSRRSICSHKLNHWVGAATRQLPVGAVLLYCAQGSGQLRGKNTTYDLDLHEDETLQFSSTEEVNEYTLHSTAGSSFYCVQITMNGDSNANSTVG
ncbi:HutD/Ves family protein [Solimicrobium silvestre]|uniref:HutD n=1 Tax=Solimicrobium silvestre TaxID=2099400 RepID=A0A2S9GT74_9BURK|nr:HutD family protein [Solimicrobium silvestre]PRC90896.1 hypothetical protein S2091_4389 [Solimicrobium silvestre]